MGNVGLFSSTNLQFSSSLRRLKWSTLLDLEVQIEVLTLRFLPEERRHTHFPQLKRMSITDCSTISKTRRLLSNQLVKWTNLTLTCGLELTLIILLRPLRLMPAVLPQTTPCPPMMRTLTPISLRPRM